MCGGGRESGGYGIYGTAINSWFASLQCLTRPSIQGRTIIERSKCIQQESNLLNLPANVVTIKHHGCNKQRVN